MFGVRTDENRGVAGHGFQMLADGGAIQLLAAVCARAVGAGKITRVVRGYAVEFNPPSFALSRTHGACSLFVVVAAAPVCVCRRLLNGDKKQQQTQVR